MSLIKNANKKISKPKEQVKEDAAGGAVGAGAIAAYAGPLLKDTISRIRTKKDRKKKKEAQRLTRFEMLSKLSSAPLLREDDNFDQAEVVNRMKSLEQRERVQSRDTVSFGLKDDKDQITLVTIPRDQADAFEQAVSAYLAKEDREGNVPEIAEILYKLKDRFDIVNVQMPDVEEDQEEMLNIPAEPGAEGAPSPAEPGAEGESGEDMDDMVADVGAEAPAEDLSDEKSLLNKVIDLLMKSEEAKKEDAKARQAMAKVKQTKVERDSLEDLVRREEQIQDMEASEKARKAQEKEVSTLAKLARYKRDKDETGEIDIPPQNKMPEDLDVDIDIEREDEESVLKGLNKSKVSSSDLATAILMKIRR